MFVTLAICTGLLALATLLPYSRCQHYLVRGCDFPRLQIAVLLLASLITQLIASGWTTPAELILLTTTIICLALQSWWIAPYLPTGRTEVARAPTPQPDRAIRILTGNVLQPNRNATAFRQLIDTEHPDIVIALEADDWWQEQLDDLEAAGFTHSIKRPLDNLYGMLVYSRLPLHGTSIEHLVEDNVPSMHTLVQLPSGARIQLHVLHPAPPSPSENETSGPRDAELVIVGRHVHDATRPVIVTGDLNDVAWSATTRLFRKLSSLLDPRIGRGMFSSFHAKVPLMRWPLDHLFHSRHFCLNEIKRLPAFGSDHFALVIELQLDATANPDDGIDPDADERAWARELRDNTESSGSPAPDTST